MSCLIQSSDELFSHITVTELFLILGKDLEQTERQYGDDYSIMAAHLLIDIHKDTSKGALLITANYAKSDVGFID